MAPTTRWASVIFRWSSCNRLRSFPFPTRSVYPDWRISRQIRDSVLKTARDSSVQCRPFYPALAVIRRFAADPDSGRAHGRVRRCGDVDVAAGSAMTLRSSTLPPCAPRTASARRCTHGYRRRRRGSAWRRLPADYRPPARGQRFRRSRYPSARYRDRTARCAGARQNVPAHHCPRHGVALRGCGRLRVT